ncbi:hypothetical protein Mmc1_1462 [Magnetococcus marinus MC-1]|uniref:DUF2157 domain-containing protein n=1 Tax=Magnetococcus marinus (strain ATCC BAA-1437 / JCM 17883 / MC-1) TaxID=156889 RepID=A0L7M8_MAGMM|nr:DUF2157 domain-containing protein [Magnetococcus marinus]ABK43971.1 hypothetical protein Mmc1_1462 [Magnetococcus marinus MC-1]
MTKLEKQLHLWVSQGLLQPQQAHAISLFEEAHGQTHSSPILQGFMGLGALAVGIGTLSIVAANWWQIADGIKLAVDLLLLLGLALGVFAQRLRGGLLYEVLLLLFALLCMASIGLIAQIFHSDGSLDEALLLWGGLTLGVTLLSQRSLLPWLWLTLTGGAGLVKLLSSVAPFMHWNFEQQLLLSMLLLPAVTSLFILLLRQRWPGMTAALHFWLLLSWITGVIWVDLLATMGERPTFQAAPPLIYGGVTLLPALLLLLFYQPLSGLRKSLLLILGVGYLLLYPLCLVWLPWEPMGAICTLLLGSTAALYAGLHESWRTLFNLLLWLIGVRLLLVYFVAFGGLAQTGVGLILGGLLLLGLIGAWHRLAAPLKRWIGGLEG